MGKVATDVCTKLLRIGCLAAMTLAEAELRAAAVWRVDLDSAEIVTNVPIGRGLVSALTIPRSAFANPRGEKSVTLLFDGTWWHLESEGHVDEDSVCEPIDHPSAPFPAGTRHFEWKALGDLQGWRPGGHNTSVGDVAGIWYAGRLHVFYLADRRHHGSKGGKGGHFFAHVSSADLKTWREHAPAVDLREWWQSVGTGTPFVLRDGRLALAYGLHTERFDAELAKGKPAGATYAVSNDGGETFVPTGAFFHTTRNPTVYNRPDGRYGMVIGYKEDGGIYVSDDLKSWELVDETTGATGDCPCLFEWNGHHYLLQGYVGKEHLLHSKSGRPGTWENRAKDIPRLYAGLAVPMVVSIPGNRRLLIGWRPDPGCWGGAMEIRELVQGADGMLTSTSLR